MAKLKGVILAGGTGSRLMPLTKQVNKHALPVGLKQMIRYPLDTLLSLGITDIMVVTGTEHAGQIFQLLGSGTEHGCKFTFKVQDQPDGIAGALLLAEEFVGKSKFVTVLGDNIVDMKLMRYCVERLYCPGWHKAGLFLYPSKTPERFGVASIETKPFFSHGLRGMIPPNTFWTPNSDGQSGDGADNKFKQSGYITHIEEKPKNPTSNLAVTGIYLYDEKVFEYIREIKPSARGEYEISDVNNAYIRDLQAQFYLMSEDDYWSDAGTPESYRAANDFAWSKIT